MCSCSLVWRPNPEKPEESVEEDGQVEVVSEEYKVTDRQGGRHGGGYNEGA